MDTLTHSLIGAVSARVITESRSRTYILVTALAAAFPDIDYLLFWLNPYQFITEWHRGPTHSLLLLPLWALLLSILFYLPMRRRISFLTLLLLCSLGLLTHIGADWLTLYGIQLLAPASDQRYALGLAFDMDPWITLIVFSALLTGFQHRKAAFVSLLLIVCYLGFLYYGQQFALQAIETRTKLENINARKIHALPQPLVPWHWRLIIDRYGYYEIAHLSLHGKASKLLRSLMTGAISKSRSTPDIPPEGVGQSNVKTVLGYYRGQSMLVWRRLYKFGADKKQTEQVKDIWQRPDLAKFRQFATVPSLYRIDQTTDSTCVWFTDLRYVFPIIKPPFRYGMCRYTSDKQWRVYRLKRGSNNDRELIKPPLPLLKSLENSVNGLSSSIKLAY